MTIKAAVLGDPVSHSLSPLMQSYWLAQHAIDGEYKARHIAASQLKETLKRLASDGYAGCNLTIPHKEEAMQWMDELSDEAKAIGAINTVIVKGNGLLYGTNTDAEGFIENLKAGANDLRPYLEHCFILGAGGAAKAIFYALKKAGAKRISISNRNRERAEHYDAEIINWEHKDNAISDVTLLINTTSLGMKGQPQLEISLDKLPREALVTDIVYQPLITPLLQQAQARANPVVTGIGMLIYQAVPGFEAWFGIRPKVHADVFELLQTKLAEAA